MEPLVLLVGPVGLFETSVVGNVLSFGASAVNPHGDLFEHVVGVLEKI